MRSLQYAPIVILPFALTLPWERKLQRIVISVLAARSLPLPPCKPTQLPCRFSRQSGSIMTKLLSTAFVAFSTAGVLADGSPLSRSVVPSQLLQLLMQQGWLWVAVTHLPPWHGRGAA